ncbi:transmembrane protein 25 isoform X4 [Crotalus tigris]|uniref:transmembrane protein 25 isoform X4 n=1 Tax=Crotalus tigris TaxID=88082 RepID=UPI00192F302C|nr:transmembrane protein 25 isoform X4 [Crotalus tigris]
MDAAPGPAVRGAPPPEAWLLCPGRPFLSPRRRRRSDSVPGSSSPARLLLLLPFLLRRATPGAVATSETRIDGRALSVSSLREAESRAFTCLAAAPNLTWYLNGERQETNSSGGGLAAAGDGLGEGGSGTFVVTARRVDHRLDCDATDPAPGRVSTASVLLNVQFQPEIVKVDAHYREASEPGLLLVLFVLVQANPPADVTWVDQDGQVTVNASRFLLLDTQTYPWLANHTVRVQLHSPPRNASLRASNGLGVASSSVPLPGHGLAVQLPLSNVLQPKEAHMTRANRSLPSDLKLNDLVPEPKSRANSAPAEQDEDAISDPNNHPVLAEQGLGQFLTVGYIYRATSMSSDEIWL